MYVAALSGRATSSLTGLALLADQGQGECDEDDNNEDAYHASGDEVDEEMSGNAVDSRPLTPVDDVVWERGEDDDGPRRHGTTVRKCAYAFFPGVVQISPLGSQLSSCKTFQSHTRSKAGALSQRSSL